MDNGRLKGIFATMLSATYFGFQPIIMKLVYQGGGNSFTAAMLRFTISLPICLIYLLINKVNLNINKSEIKKILFLSIFISSTTLFLYSSYLFIPSGMATTIHFLYPTFTMIGSILLYKNKIIKSKLVAIILCLIGILLFFDNSAGFTIPGFTLALISALTYAYYSIYLEHSGLSDLNPIKLIFYSNIFSAIFMLIVGLAFRDINFYMTSTAWAAMIAVSLLNTFVGLLGYQIGIKYIGAESTSILSTFEPIVSVVMGCIIYLEPITIRAGFACACILIATVLVAKNK